MKLIVGLGNPGDTYIHSRHNAGFMVMDACAKRIAPRDRWQQKKKYHAQMIKTSQCMLLKPQTYMNRSGLAVQAAVDYLGIEATDVWVVYDDKDLPLGSMRIRQQGGAGGHNGVSSIISSIGTDEFVRFRLGVGPVASAGTEASLMDTSTYVLSAFKSSEQKDLDELIQRVCEALESALSDGIVTAMNAYNKRGDA